MSKHNIGCRVVHDGGSFARCQLAGLERSFALDLVFEPQADLAEPLEVEGILTESQLDLRTFRLTCLLSRSEPRDLVDVLLQALPS